MTKRHRHNRTAVRLAVPARTRLHQVGCSQRPPSRCTLFETQAQEMRHTSHEE
jgi:hypothetical protein